MVRYPITPRISDHEGELHIHAASKTQSVAELLVGEALIGLAFLIVRPRPHAARDLRRRQVRQRLRRHLPQRRRAATAPTGAPRAPTWRRTAPVRRRRRRKPRRPPVHDGPLIVQSDKTLLLEVDHERAGECRRAIAPFAELERSPEHIHTYRLTPLGLWNARAAGHDAEQVVDTLLEFSRYAVPHALLVDVAETMARYGRLRLEKHPTHGLVLVTTDRPVLEEVLRAKKIAGMIGDRIDDDTRRRPRLRARQPQAGAAQDRLAGRGLRRLRRRRGAPDRARRDRVAPARLPARRRRVVLARRVRRGRAALRRRQDAGRRGRHGARPGHHADPRHQHGGAPGSGRTSWSGVRR